MSINEIKKIYIKNSFKNQTYSLNRKIYANYNILRNRFFEKQHTNRY